MRRILKKIISAIGLIPLIILGILLVLYFLFLPAILEYAIEKQGENQLGRKVDVGYVNLNILNGSFVIKNLTIYEPDGQNPFLSFRRLFINFSVPELFKKVYHVEGLNLDEPVIHIFQQDSTFNFSDIIERLTADTTSRDETAETAGEDESAGPVKYIVEHFALTSGTFSYSNPDFHLKDTIINFNLSIPHVSYDDPQVNLSFFFDLASGGNFKGRCGFNTADESLTLYDTISNFNLSNYKHYLDPYLKIGSLNGYFHTRNFLKGNAANFDLELTGDLKLTDVAMTDTTGSLVAGFSEFSVIFNSISFSDDVLNFDTISLIGPVINFMMTPEGDNFSAMLPETGPGDTLSGGEPAGSAYTGANPVEMMVAYIQESMDNYLFNNYRINQIRLLDGKIVYDDRSLNEPFVFNLDNLDVILSNLTTEVDRSYGSLEARLNEDGLFTALINVNPRDILDMELKYDIRSLQIPDFNPLSLYYIAHPFPRGTFNYSGTLRISDKKLKSDNEIVIEEINIGEKVKNNTAVYLPIKLAIAILRDRNGDIRLNIPVEGDLADPKIKMGRLILGILKNLVIKAATTPYDLLASAFGGKEEDLKEIKFDYLSDKLTEKHKKQLESISVILAEKPELKISFDQAVDQDKEKGAIAIWETRKIYYFEYLAHQDVPVRISSEDSLRIKDIKVNQEFETFLAYRLDSTLMKLGLDEKCYQIAGIGKVNLLEQNLLNARNRAVASYLETVLAVPPERFSVMLLDDPASINPEYPCFRINFGVDE